MLPTCIYCGASVQICIMLLQDAPHQTRTPPQRINLHPQPLIAALVCKPSTPSTLCEDPAVLLTRLSKLGNGGWLYVGLRRECLYMKAIYKAQSLIAGLPEVEVSCRQLLLCGADLCSVWHLMLCCHLESHTHKVLVER
jgi:hypothetical protein